MKWKFTVSISFAVQHQTWHWGPGEYPCQMFYAWCIFAALLYVSLLSFFERSWDLDSGRLMHCGRWAKICFLLPSVDIGGGLVVVCMTSFTSMFGVTSYVRLLNCYTGHQRSHKSEVIFFFLLQAFTRQVRKIFWSNVTSFFLRKKRQRQEVSISIVIKHVQTISQARYSNSSNNSENASAQAWHSERLNFQPKKKSAR